MLTYKNTFSSFSSNDIPKAKEFYEKVLGLQTTDSMGGLDIKLTGGGSVFIYPKPDHVPATFTVLNFNVANIDDAVDGLTQAGVKFEIYNYPGLKTDDKGIARGGDGPNIAWFKDPSGNILSVIEVKA